MLLHPATKILALVLFAVALPWIPIQTLGIISVLLLIPVIAKAAYACAKLLRASRWLLVSLILVYALTTPGTPILNGWPAPTLEGTQSGLIQAWRIVLMLAALAWLSATTSRDSVLVVIYTLLAPLGRVGLDAARLTARIALTLRYVAQLPRLRDWRRQLSDALDDKTAAAGEIELQTARFGWADALAGVLFVAVCGLLL
ncbi:MAG: CbiQ family ECF transporter T component [Burkholderiales bacterium]